VKATQVCTAVLLICFAVVTARADGVPSSDPRIIVGHGADAVDCGLTFTITVDIQGGGHKPCRNTSGVDWTGLNFFVTLPVGTLVMPSCPSTSAFGGCSVITSLAAGHETVEVEFFDGSIPSHALFFVSLNDDHTDKDGSGGWPKGTVITGDAVVPEPATFLLLASGIGVLCLRRKAKLVGLSSSLSLL
jgi:PEP-CTERM motif